MNSPGMSPSMDAIQEFRVLDNTSAEFGRSSGSNVNIVSSSQGRADLHGSAYEYLRNDKFDANDFFANKKHTGKVPFRQNQYGSRSGARYSFPRFITGATRRFGFSTGKDIGHAAGRRTKQLPNPGPARRRFFLAWLESALQPFTGTPGADGKTIRQPFANNLIRKR